MSTIKLSTSPLKKVGAATGLQLNNSPVSGINILISKQGFLVKIADCLLLCVRCWSIGGYTLVNIGENNPPSFNPLTIDPPAARWGGGCGRCCGQIECTQDILKIYLPF